MKRYALDMRVHPILVAKNGRAAAASQAILDGENPLATFRTLRRARRTKAVLDRTATTTINVIRDMRTGKVVA